MKTIFTREYQSSHAGYYDQPGRCPRPGCKRELVPLNRDPQRYCSKTCKKSIEDREKALVQATPGFCAGCGALLPAPVYHCVRAKNAYIKNWRKNAGGKLRFGPEAWEWLAEKLKIPYSPEITPKLATIAQHLAHEGHLTILIQGEPARIIGLAKPKSEGAAPK